MKVLLLGAAGGMAYATIKDLLEFDVDDLTELVLADKDYDKVQAVARKMQSPKVRAIQLDCTNFADLVKAMEGFDVVINETTFSDIPVLVLKAALEVGANVVDLGADTKGTKEMMALDDKCRNAGLTAILGLGYSPGVVGVTARAIVDDLDIVKSIKILFTYAAIGQSTVPFKVPFYGCLGEFINSPKVYDEGETKLVPPRSGIEEITYPEPFGKRVFQYIPHSEITTFPIVFKDKGLEHCSIKGGFLPDFREKAAFLAEIGLLSTEPLKVGDMSIVPMDLVETCVKNLPPEKGDIKHYGISQVIVTGFKENTKVRVTATVNAYPYQDLTTSQHRTGHAPAIGAHLIHKGIIKKKGAFPPENGVDPAPFFKELARRELEVEIDSVTYL